MIKPLNLGISMVNFFFKHLITCAFVTKINSPNEIEKILCDVQWLMNHLQNHINNYIFIYFGMPLKWKYI